MSLTILRDGTRVWKNEAGHIHREDGPGNLGQIHPAIEHSNGDKEWLVNGRLHRLDGPAREWINGEREWFVNGKLHRIDGPAIEYKDGSCEWWVNGTRVETLIIQK